jgi:hypothetical protein
MKTKTVNSFLLISFTIAGFILLSASSFAQQKSEDQPNAKKTITIHVTKDVDGHTTVIDTTIVTTGDFDADAFLQEKGVLKEVPEDGRNVERRIIIRHPGEKEFSWSDKGGNVPDTINFNGDKLIILDDNFDKSVPPPHHRGMQFRHNYNNPPTFPPMQGPQFEDMMEDMLKTFGLEDVMPFGEMKQVVVKKKNHGKKVIITFEDREGGSSEKSQGNKKEEKVIIYRNGEQGMAPQNEEHYIIEGQNGEKTVITKNVETKGTQKIITVKADVDDSIPVKQEKHIIIIQEDKSK